MLEKSSELIHSGDVIKTSSGSSQDRVMFLFDHQLVYCKKVRTNEKDRLFIRNALYLSRCNHDFWKLSISSTLLFFNTSSFSSKELRISYLYMSCRAMFKRREIPSKETIDVLYF